MMATNSRITGIVENGRSRGWRERTLPTWGTGTGQAGSREAARSRSAARTWETLRRTATRLFLFAAALASPTLAAVSAFAASPAAAESVEETRREILECFDRWNRALQSGDPGQVAALYAEDAILLPTVSNRVRHNHEEIRDYFRHFLADRPSGKIDEANVRIYGNMAINSGLYTFSFPDKPPLHGRFTFVYRWNGNRWEILEHHSSRMPE
jgi:uncharacterized protein (TIGR02246 family)